MVWIDARKLYFRAEIRASAGAREAIPTGHLRLDGDAVAFEHICDPIANFEHDTCPFVAQNTIAIHS